MIAKVQLYVTKPGLEIEDLEQAVCSPCVSLRGMRSHSGFCNAILSTEGVSVLSDVVTVKEVPFKSRI